MSNGRGWHCADTFLISEDGDIDGWECPICGKVSYVISEEIESYAYCPKCGGKIYEDEDKRTP